MKDMINWRERLDEALDISERLRVGGFPNEIRINGAIIRIRVNKTNYTAKDRDKIAAFMRVLGKQLSKSYTNTNRVKYIGVIDGINILMNTNIPAKDNCILVKLIKPITATHYACQKL